jgi:hypothetical protein
MTTAKLQSAYKEGMLKRTELKDGRYYLGYCRNAVVAQWDQGSKRFFHVRTKFGSRFIESIPHPEDDGGYDIFVPVKRVRPTEEQKVWKRPDHIPY